MTITATTDPLLTAKESAKTLQCSEPTFWRWVAAGTVPKPVKLGALSRWPQSEILAVIEKAKAAREQTAACKSRKAVRSAPKLWPASLSKVVKMCWSYIKPWLIFAFRLWLSGNAA